MLLKKKGMVISWSCYFWSVVILSEEEQCSISWSNLNPLNYKIWQTTQDQVTLKCSAAWPRFVAKLLQNNCCRFLFQFLVILAWAGLSSSAPQFSRNNNNDLVTSVISALNIQDAVTAALRGQTSTSLSSSNRASSSSSFGSGSAVGEWSQWTTVSSPVVSTVNRFPTAQIANTRFMMVVRTLYLIIKHCAGQDPISTPEDRAVTLSRASSVECWQHWVLRSRELWLMLSDQQQQQQQQQLWATLLQPMSQLQHQLRSRTILRT